MTLARSTVRQANAADRDALIALNPGLLRAGHGAERAWASLAAGRVLVAEVNGRVVGQLVYDYHFFDRAFIEHLIVHPEFRRRGIGAALVREAVTRCDTHDVFTSTNESNIPMQAMLAKLGFQHAGTVDHLDPGDPEWFYVLQK
jgi:ribosomal protein S18 acetylase RimI-like enzyme